MNKVIRRESIRNRKKKVKDKALGHNIWGKRVGTEKPQKCPRRSKQSFQENPEMTE